MEIGPDAVVVIHYTMKDNAGKILDSSEGQGPMAYLQGHDNVVPGLEKELAGKTAGAKLSVSVSPADGYGERTGPGPQRVKKKEFGKDADKLRQGLSFRADSSDGTPVTLWITKVEGAWVHVDTNHPLAGETLNFEVKVIEVREGSAEEIAHGHVHGAHGHHH
jgi:FKBP-type peptidyl-prolyl cis-trans isomerase SlyD